MKRNVIIFISIVLCLLLFLISQKQLTLACSLVIISIIFVLFSIKENNDEAERQEELKKRELELANEDLVNMVRFQTIELIRKLKNSDEEYNFLEYDETNLNWLLAYKEKLEDIMETRINGKPDTFIEASCLILALAENNYITTDYKDLDALTGQFRNKLLTSINLDLAFKIAFVMISNPTTYVEVSEGNWVKSPGKTVKNITFPDGIIKDYPLYDRIIRSLCKGEEISVMQLSNMLHLLYLYNRDCKEQ